MTRIVARETSQAPEDKDPKAVRPDVAGAGVGWPPAMVVTPMGMQPLEKALQWHLPTILRWIDHNRDAERAPDGTLVGHVLQTAASQLERANR